MFSRLERSLWPITVPPEVGRRRVALAQDFRYLALQRYIPIDPKEILDMGSGSGAGSVALRDTFPRARIVAVDGAQNWQSYALYRRKKPPSDITFVPATIEESSSTIPNSFDLIVAARICISLDESRIASWTKKARAIERTLVAILSHLQEGGTFAISWPSGENGDFARVINDNFLMHSLFTSETSDIRRNDCWHCWQGFHRDQLDRITMDPDTLLTNFARTSYDIDPYDHFSDL